jgi:1,4-alpha-glucan branching enzyme
MKKQTVSKKKKVTFSIVAPDAKIVSLAGSFTNWDEAPVELKKEKNGVWKKTLTLEPGTYEYRILVDGQWQDDPQCDQRVPNPFGTQNCLRMIA